VTTSLSNLIKREHHGRLKIETFRVQEIEADPFSSNLDIGDLGGGKGHRAVGMDRLSKIEMEAYKKGFEQGQRDGLALGEKRIEEAVKKLENLLQSLSELKGQLYRESEQEIVRLSMEIARKIVHRELTIDAQAVTRTIQAAIQYLNDSTSIRIIVNPADMERLREVLPDLQAGKKIEKIEVTEDPAVEQGGCILETGFGKINATIEDQLSAIAQELEEELAKSGEEHATVS